MFCMMVHLTWWGLLQKWISPVASFSVLYSATSANSCNICMIFCLIWLAVLWVQGSPAAPNDAGNHGTAEGTALINRLMRAESSKGLQHSSSGSGQAPVCLICLDNLTAEDFEVGLLVCATSLHMQSQTTPMFSMCASNCLYWVCYESFWT